eukprot:gene1488-877_t
MLPSRLFDGHQAPHRKRIHDPEELERVYRELHYIPFKTPRLEEPRFCAPPHVHISADGPATALGPHERGGMPADSRPGDEDPMSDLLVAVTEMLARDASDRCWTQFQQLILYGARLPPSSLIQTTLERTARVRDSTKLLAALSVSPSPSKEDASLAEEYVQAGADVWYMDEKKGVPLLFGFINKGRVECVEACLKTPRPLDWSRAYSYGWTALHYICDAPRLKVAAALLRMVVRRLEERVGTDRTAWISFPWLRGGAGSTFFWPLIEHLSPFADSGTMELRVPVDPRDAAGLPNEYKENYFRGPHLPTGYIKIFIEQSSIPPASLAHLFSPLSPLSLAYGASDADEDRKKANHARKVEKGGYGGARHPRWPQFTHGGVVLEATAQKIMTWARTGVTITGAGVSTSHTAAVPVSGHYPLEVHVEHVMLLSYLAQLVPRSHGRLKRCARDTFNSSRRSTRFSFGIRIPSAANPSRTGCAPWAIPASPLPSDGEKNMERLRQFNAMQLRESVSLFGGVWTDAPVQPRESSGGADALGCGASFQHGRRPPLKSRRPPPTPPGDPLQGDPLEASSQEQWTLQYRTVGHVVPGAVRHMTYPAYAQGILLGLRVSACPFYPGLPAGPARALPVVWRSHRPPLQQASAWICAPHQQRAMGYPMRAFSDSLSNHLQMMTTTTLKMRRSLKSNFSLICRSSCYEFLYGGVIPFFFLRFTSVCEAVDSSGFKGVTREKHPKKVGTTVVVYGGNRISLEWLSTPSLTLSLSTAFTISCRSIYENIEKGFCFSVLKQRRRVALKQQPPKQLKNNNVFYLPPLTVSVAPYPHRNSTENECPTDPCADKRERETSPPTRNRKKTKQNNMNKEVRQINKSQTIEIKSSNSRDISTLDREPDLLPLDPRILAIPPECFDETFLDFLRFDAGGTIYSAGPSSAPAGAAASRAGSSVMFKKNPIRQFSSPPSPAASPRRSPFAIENVSTSSSRRLMSETERKRILERVERLEHHGEEECQVRLSRLRERNSATYITNVLQRSARMTDEVRNDRLDSLMADERRRDEIHFRSQNAVLLQRANRLIDRAQRWYVLVVAHIFIRDIIKAQRVHEALQLLRKLLGPIVKKIVLLKRERLETEAFLEKLGENAPRPTPEVIMQMKGLFANWPFHLLELLSSKATPKYMKQGRFLIHADNHDRSMFMITLGTVSIVFRNKSLKDKRRRRDNGIQTLILETPCYVGEYGLVCKETRTASVYCETDVLAWVVTPNDYEQVAQYLTPDLAMQQRTAADCRRKENLRKLFTVRVKNLRRRFVFFNAFSDAALTRLTQCIEPIVLHGGEVLFTAGSVDPNAYFIQDGHIIIRDESGEERELSKGALLGIFECACAVNEKKKYSATSLNDCDIWCLSRDLLLDVGMTEPHALLECRKAAKVLRAREIKKDPAMPWYFRYDPYLSFCFLPSHLSKIYGVAQPAVYLHGETLAEMGAPLTALITVIRGAVDVTICSRQGIETFRMVANFNEVAEEMEEEGACEAENEAEKQKRREVPGTKGHSFIFGGYEYASAAPEFLCTVRSHGLTEALVTDIRQVDNIIPPQLRKIIDETVEARDVVKRAYEEQNFRLLTNSKVPSFAAIYRPPKAKHNYMGGGRKYNFLYPSSPYLYHHILTILRILINHKGTDSGGKIQMHVPSQITKKPTNIYIPHNEAPSKRFLVPSSLLFFFLFPLYSFLYIYFALFFIFVFFPLCTLLSETVCCIRIQERIIVRFQQDLFEFHSMF